MNMPRMAVVPRSSDVFAQQKLAFNAPKDGRGIGQKQVLAQNLSSIDIQECISLERYTDVQQLKMVQMLAQSPDFAIYIYSSDTFIRLWK